MNRTFFSLSSALVLVACGESGSLAGPDRVQGATSSDTVPDKPEAVAQLEAPPVIAPEATIPGSRYTTDAVGYTIGRLGVTPVRRPAPTGRDEFAAWAGWARQHLAESITVFRFEEGQLPLETVVLRSDAFDGYRRDEISYFVERGLRVRAFLYLPAADGPHPAVVFWHGHTFGGYHSSAGISPFDRESNPHRAGAVALAEAGFVVLAPNVRTFGPGGGLDAHEHFERIMPMSGASALGAFASDAHRGVDVLVSTPEVDRSRIGVTGLSLGGLLTILSAALDERVIAAVPQGFFGSYRESLLSSDGCSCVYGGALGIDFDLADVAALVAPRPLRIVAGEGDREFPLESQRRAFAELQHSYSLSGAADSVEFVVHEGGHEWEAGAAVEFLNAHLRSVE